MVLDSIKWGEIIGWELCNRWNVNDDGLNYRVMGVGDWECDKSKKSGGLGSWNRGGK